jgi:hypothetical protein
VGVLVTEDDSWYGHRRGASPWWSETGLFGFLIPERNINGWFYFWHRPNMNLTASGIAIWDGLGEEQHNCLFYDWSYFNPFPGEGADHFDFELDNGMRVDLLEPLNSYRLRFDSKMSDCRLDLKFTGTVEPQEFSFTKQKDDGYRGSPGTEELGQFHYEQMGHVKGSFTIRDEKFEVDCHHWRDRSWGPRVPLRTIAGGGQELGWASENTSFITLSLRPDKDLPLDQPSEDNVSYGSFVKNGQVSHVSSGRRRVVQRRPDGAPERIVLNLEDAEGRDFHAEGIVRNCLKYDELWFVHWGLVEWELEGETGWGETQDWIPKDVIRAQQRAALSDDAMAGAQ